MVGFGIDRIISFTYIIICHINTCIRIGETLEMSKIIHRRPIFIKFELDCIDFMDRLSQKGLTLIAIENNSVVFRVEHKEEIEEIITS